MDLYYYLLLVVPALLLSLIAQARVQSAYKRYSKLPNLRGLTGARAAEAVLAHYGVQGVRIEHVRGRLNDHYDPRDNVIRLSDGVYGGCSVAAVGIACHEAGHAAQYALGYVPIRVRNGLLRPAQIGSQISWPLAIGGLFLGSQPLVLFGIILYVAVMLFQLITLPVEFNASRRALAVIDETGLPSGAERDGAAKVLRAAAMTYVAAFAVTAANLLRLLLLANRRN